ncbi:MAG: hypothetical protein JO340_19760 [Acidobacteriaceae bacterium]|nr:hypothetical protein [Acidobacteriaceae bacterium]
MSRPNSFIAIDGSQATTLTYMPHVQPAPLTISVPDQPPTLGSLEIIITNQESTTLDIESIEFIIPVGPGATLTPTTQGIQTAVSDSAKWQIVPPWGTIMNGTASYTLQPATGSSAPLKEGQSVVVQIYSFQTIESPATASIGIKEKIGGATKTGGFDVTTYPYGFYFTGLIATVASGSDFVPVAQVTNPSKVTLVWNSSVVDSGAFKIYYSNASNGQQTDSPEYAGQWTSPEITSDTVFTVSVTVVTTGGAPLTAAMSVAVSVQNPDEVVKLLTAQDIVATGVIEGFGTAPVGTVLDFWVAQGVNLSIPANFVICDGRAISDPQSPFNGKNAPDLRKRFIHGVGTLSEIGSTGGNTNADVRIDSTVNGATGPITNPVPSSANTKAGLIARNVPSTEYRFDLTKSDVGWNDGQHVHSLNFRASGSTNISIMPPYYGLLKIMRIK